MHPRRLSVKYFVTNPAVIDLPKFGPVFQRWIQRDWVEGLLIDVANYDHVPQGPGVILIGDEGDYALDIRDGRPGLMYTRKRQMAATLQDTLHTVFRLTVIAAQKVETEPTLKGITFDYSQAQVTFLDRLNTPNTPEVFAAIQAEIKAFAVDLYAGADISTELAYTDPREPLSLHVRAAGPVDASSLIERLTASAAIRS
ncbi:MAG TPA: hypothetical protein VKY59_01325 [Spirillospora sp.]|nr:hypothetical protein [Spirillospora sp.]